MRRIRTFGRGEADRGATAILVAFLLTGLLGLAGLAIDLGASYAKHTELQTGADAAALALAQEYAFEDDPCGSAKDSGDAEVWVELNVKNDKSVADGKVLCKGEVDPPLKDNQLKVVADTKLQHWFMPVVGKDSSQLVADATVEFGVPGGLTTSPVAIADCAIPDAEDIEAGVEIVVWFPDPSGKVDEADAGTCGWHSKNPPGGFGVIEPDTNGSCDITITLPVELPSAPGNSKVSEDCMAPMIGVTNFVPIYDESAFTGANGKYYIVNFAAINVSYIGFGGNKEWGNTTLGCPSDRPLWTHQSQDMCLRGVFEGLVSIEDYIGDELVMPGDGDTAIVVRLID